VRALRARTLASGRGSLKVRHHRDARLPAFRTCTRRPWLLDAPAWQFPKAPAHDEVMATRGFFLQW